MKTNRLTGRSTNKLQQRNGHFIRKLFNGSVEGCFGLSSQVIVSRHELMINANILRTSVVGGAELFKHTCCMSNSNCCTSDIEFGALKRNATCEGSSRGREKAEMSGKKQKFVFVDQEAERQNLHTAQAKHHGRWCCKWCKANSRRTTHKRKQQE